MKFLFVIMTCLKNKHLWPKLLENTKDCILFCGKKMDCEYILDDRILYLNCDDSYEGLPEKVICMIDAIVHIPIFKNVTHIYKLDDHDTIIPETIYNDLCSLQHEIESHHYLGQKIWKVGENDKDLYAVYHFGKCSPSSKWYRQKYTGPYTPWLGGGTGYILSRFALECINSVYTFSNKDTVSDLHIYEDVMIALLLAKHGILPYLIKPVLRKIYKKIDSAYSHISVSTNVSTDTYKNS